MNQKAQIRVAAIFMFIGIALGAFGAHGLRDKLAATGHGDTWKTATVYLLVHGVALLAVAMASAKSKPALCYWAWVIGIVIFSGSLYALSLTGVGKLGAVTPIGGLAFLVGWAAVIFKPSQVLGE